MQRKGLVSVIYIRALPLTQKKNFIAARNTVFSPSVVKEREREHNSMHSTQIKTKHDIRCHKHVDSGKTVDIFCAVILRLFRNDILPHPICREATDSLRLKLETPRMFQLVHRGFNQLHDINRTTAYLVKKTPWKAVWMFSQGRFVKETSLCFQTCFLAGKCTKCFARKTAVHEKYVSGQL